MNILYKKKKNALGLPITLNSDQIAHYKIMLGDEIFVD